MSESQLAALIKKNQIIGACGWLDTIAKQCLDGGEATNLHLDGPVGLITIGTHNRNVLLSGVDSLTLETAGTEYATKLENYCFQYDVWLSRWRDAAADVAAVGLDGSTTSYSFWQQHVELPDEARQTLSTTQKWFDTVEWLVETTDLDPTRLVNFSNQGLRRLQAIRRCEGSWPRARRDSIHRRVMRMYALAMEWELTAARKFADQAADADKEGAMTRLSEAIEHSQEASNILRGHQVKMQRKWERQLKKRTCSMCGKTAPNSSHAFAYCGGCRHASIPRVDRPRYCSEACQRAHWLAGHKNECPCAHEE